MNSGSVAFSPAAYAGVRAVVLGAAGFVGRWVARALCRQGTEPFLVVRDRPAATQVFARYGIIGRLVVADLASLDVTRDLIQTLRPAIIFNLAGYGVDRTELDEHTAYLLNAGLVEAICEAMAASGDTGWAGQRVVHAGSALEYGAIGGNLAEDSLANPTTLYGRSKLAGTQALVEAGQRLGLRGVTARLFTVYGPGEDSDRLLPSLLRTARTGKPLALTAGLQQRDFTYVEDVTEGLLRLGCSRARPGDVVNLATGRLSTVRTFVETAAMVLGIPPDCLHLGAIPTRPEEMRHDPVAVRRLRELTNWAPGIRPAEGIKRTWTMELDKGLDG
jgi:nucleoside-diphosphate-sugar epimerase